VNDLFVRYVMLLAVGLSGSACGGPGSCLLTTPGAGYDYCKDYLGTEFNSSVAQNDCATNNGKYQSGACSTAGALATCSVGTGTANDYQYTYFAAGSSSDAGALSTVTLESACGVAGGTFTAH
jgi:hypothetical protein